MAVSERGREEARSHRQLCSRALLVLPPGVSRAARGVGGPEGLPAATPSLSPDPELRLSCSALSLPSCLPPASALSLCLSHDPWGQDSHFQDEIRRPHCDPGGPAGPHPFLPYQSPCWPLQLPASVLFSTSGPLYLLFTLTSSLTVSLA